MKNKIHFLSFADSRMSAATDRIADQAARMEIFDEIHVLNEKHLDNDFCQKYLYFIFCIHIIYCNSEFLSSKI